MKLNDFGRKVETGILVTLAVVLSALFYVKCWPKDSSSVVIASESETNANTDDDTELTGDNSEINGNGDISENTEGYIESEVSDSEPESVETPEIPSPDTSNSISTSADSSVIKTDPPVESTPVQATDKADASSKTQSAAETTSSSEVHEESGVININTATSEQLQTLTGIGEVKAQAIIDYRESCGAFSRIEEITEVSGIGEKTFENIRDRITV